MLLYVNVQGRPVEDVLPLIFAEKVHSVNTVAYSSVGISIQGYITVPPAAFHHKHKQYLYVNNRHVKPGQTGKLINNLFKKTDLEPEQQHQQQLKAKHQYPAFALQIICPANAYDVTSDPDKQHVEFTDWPSALSAVQAAVLQAWHSVVGDRLLRELTECKQYPADMQPESGPSAAARASMTAAIDQPNEAAQLPSRIGTDDRAPVSMRKCKRGLLTSGLCTSEEDQTLAKLFGAPAIPLKAPLDQPCNFPSNDTWSADAGKPQHPNAQPAVAGGLLAKLQSSTKLRFSGHKQHYSASGITCCPQPNTAFFLLLTSHSHMQIATLQITRLQAKMTSTCQLSSPKKLHLTQLKAS